MLITVAIVDPAMTYALRHRVLRPDAPLAETAEINSLPGALTFGLTCDDDAEVISTATIYPEDPPPHLTPIVALTSTHRPWRLRAVATHEAHRSQAHGARVMTAVLDHLAGRGPTVLWCNARSDARDFYLREGFVTEGETFTIEGIGPHQVMYRTIV